MAAPSLFLLLLFFAAVAISSVTSISMREYESMERVMRGHGYSLICNAMATSDLQYEILTLPPNASFTIFAPTDASLFAADMIQTASSYTDTLRLHFVPLRLSLSDLRSISNGSILPTLLPYSALRLTTAVDPLRLAGVDLVLPGLFYSRRVAVHGLAGILSLTSVVSYGSALQAAPPVPDQVSPLKTASDLAPPPSNGTDLSQAGSVSPAAPSPGENLSPVSDQSPAESPAPGNSVPEVARVFLMETSEDDGQQKTDGGNEISEVIKKSGPSDELTVDCIVAADEEADQTSLGRLVQALA